MRREDFKKILPVHFESCRKIIAVQGRCRKSDVRCVECPFSSRNNNKNNYGCWGAGYANPLAKYYDRDDKHLVAKCEEFLKLFGGEKE